MTNLKVFIAYYLRAPEETIKPNMKQIANIIIEK